MRLAEIEAFDAVMRTGSTVRAAEFLGISQPAVSRALQRLADHTRLPLFKTIKGRLVPTPEALRFHEDVRRSFVGLDQLRASAAALREFGSGRLRIACYPALGLSFLPRVVRRHRELCPDAVVNLQVVGSAAARDLVVSEQVDLALTADEIDTTQVEATVFMTPPAVLVMPKEHELASRDVIRPADLRGQPYLALSPNDTIQRRMARLCEDAGVDLRIVVETQYSETVCNLALEGAGVGLANAASVRASGFAGRGLVVRTFEPALSFKALLVQSRTRTRSALASHFATTLYAVRNEMGAG